MTRRARRHQSDTNRLTEDQKKWLAWPIRRYCVEVPFSSEQQAREAFEAHEDELLSEYTDEIPPEDAPGGENWSRWWDSDD